MWWKMCASITMDLLFDITNRNYINFFFLIRLWACYHIWSFGSNLMVSCRSRSPPAGGARGAASCQDSRGRSVRRRRVVLLHSLGIAPEGGGGAQGHCDLLLSAGRCSGRRSARGEDDGSVWSSRSWENTAVVRHPHTHTLITSSSHGFVFHS